MKNNIAVCLGRNIRLYRQKNGLSQRALAELAGISPGFLAMLDKGEKFPTAEVLYRIGRVLGVSAARLFTDDKDVFGRVSREQWTVFQGILERITVLTEELHDMLEDFQQKTPPGK